MRLASLRRHGALLLALAMAAVTGLLVYQFLERYAESVPVVVVARDIEGPTLITDGDLRVVAVPSPAFHPQAFHNPDEVVGRWLKIPAVSGQMVLAPHLADGPTGGSPLQIALDADQVGFFLPAPLERMLGGAVSAGDDVDLIFVGSPGRGEAARAEHLSTALTVLEVRDQDGLDVEGDRRGRALPAGLVLAVTPYDAQRLAFAIEHGQIYVALRSAFAPAATPWASGITWDNLLLYIPALDPAFDQAGDPAQ